LILKKLGRAAESIPLIGAAASALSGILSAADKKSLRQQMERVVLLGRTSEELTALVNTLARKLTLLRWQLVSSELAVNAALQSYSCTELVVSVLKGAQEEVMQLVEGKRKLAPAEKQARKDSEELLKMIATEQFSLHCSADIAADCQRRADELALRCAHFLLPGRKTYEEVLPVIAVSPSAPSSDGESDVSVTAADALSEPQVEAAVLTPSYLTAASASMHTQMTAAAHTPSQPTAAPAPAETRINATALTPGKPSAASDQEEMHSTANQLARLQAMLEAQQAEVAAYRQKAEAEAAAHRAELQTQRERAEAHQAEMEALRSKAEVHEAHRLHAEEHRLETEAKLRAQQDHFERERQRNAKIAADVAKLQEEAGSPIDAGGGLAYQSAHAKPKSPLQQLQVEAALEARMLQLESRLADLTAQVARQGEEQGVAQDPQREAEAKAELAQLRAKLVAKKLQAVAGASSWPRRSQKLQ
jgi:hypothetical protein